MERKTHKKLILKSHALKIKVCVIYFTLQKRSSTNIFKVGNGVFLDEGFNVNPAFKRIAMKDFNSEVNQIKFSRPQQAAQKINNWIAAITNNKINQLLTPGKLFAFLMTLQFLYDSK